MAAKLVRTFDVRKFRHGDTFFSRGTSAKSDTIAYATAWSRGREGRRRARAAVRNPNYATHAGNIHESWGQFYPIEASIRGYERGDLDEYRTDECWFVRVYRWKGFQEPRKQTLCANTLEYWSRKNGRKKYDLWGAITSSRLGQCLFPFAKADDGALYCSEGAIKLHVICGIVDVEFPYDVDLRLVRRYMELNKDRLPESYNPAAVMEWMQTNPEFEEVTGYILR
jgi:hypothetical protein